MMMMMIGHGDYFVVVMIDIMMIDYDGDDW